VVDKDYASLKREDAACNSRREISKKKKWVLCENSLKL